MMYNWFYQNFFVKKYFCEDIKKEQTFLNIAIIPQNRKYINLYIDKRFLYMLKIGIIEETESIYNKSKLNLNFKSINSIGYKDIWLYLENKINFFELKNSIVKSTKNLSKKQKTWIKKWNNDIYYFEKEDKNIINNISILIKKHSYQETYVLSINKFSPPDIDKMFTFFFQKVKNIFKKMKKMKKMKKKITTIK